MQQVVHIFVGMFGSEEIIETCTKFKNTVALLAMFGEVDDAKDCW